MSRRKRVKRFSDSEYRKKMRKAGYYPMPVELKWKPAPYGGGSHVELFKEGRSEPVLATNIVAAGPVASLAVDNLEIARRYRWRVTDLAGHAAEAVFRTEDFAPRMIRLPEVPNVRDLGGRVGLGGRRVKQGMAFRSAGLNDNASIEYYTVEELLSMPEYRGQVEPYLEMRDKFLSITNGAPDAKALPARLSGTWALFLPGGERETFDEKAGKAFAALDSIPDEFLGAPRTMLDIPDGKTHFFDKALANGPAILMQEVESPEDGWLAMSAGGDYWWNIRVNGELVFDLVKAGNVRWPYGPSNYKLAIPMKKGSNVLSVTLFSGNDTWSWGCTSMPGASLADAAADMAGAAYQNAREQCRVEKALTKGRNRLTPAALDYALHDLGIKSDIDLRTDRECWGMEGSPLGPDVTWFHYSSGQYASMDTKFGKDAFRKVFSVFLDEGNYPIDFHCIAGQDRTGAVAFILNALLGVKEEELWRDWEATGFWNGSMSFTHTRFMKLIDVFDRYPGRTVNERVEAYVASCGITPEEIEKFRSIMLEE